MIGYRNFDVRPGKQRTHMEIDFVCPPADEQLPDGF
jgi:hypothetical protein